ANALVASGCGAGWLLLRNVDGVGGRKIARPVGRGESHGRWPAPSAICTWYCRRSAARSGLDATPAFAWSGPLLVRAGGASSRDHLACSYPHTYKSHSTADREPRRLICSAKRPGRVVQVFCRATDDRR